MKILTVANEKGGVGKSMLSFHAAHYFAAQERTTLLVDLDQQQAAVTEAVLAYASPTDAIALFAGPATVEPVGNLTVAARTRQLEAIERESVREMATTFRDNLRAMAGVYEFVVIDTPPAHGVRTAAGLLAADLVVSPIELNEASLEAVQSVMDNLATVCAAFGKPMPDLTRQRPLLVSRYSTHSRRQRALFEELAGRVGKIVIDGAIVARDAYARYRAEQKPVWDMRDDAGRMTRSTRDAADEIRAVLGRVEAMMEGA